MGQFLRTLSEMDSMYSWNVAATEELHDRIADLSLGKTSARLLSGCTNWMIEEEKPYQSSPSLGICRKAGDSAIRIEGDRFAHGAMMHHPKHTRSMEGH